MIWEEIKNDNNFNIYGLDKGKFHDFLEKNEFDLACHLDSSHTIKKMLNTGLKGMGQINLLDINDKLKLGLDRGCYFKNSKTDVTCLVYRPCDDIDVLKPSIIKYAKEHNLNVQIYSLCRYDDDVTVVILSLPYDEFIFI